MRARTAAPALALALSLAALTRDAAAAPPPGPGTDDAGAADDGGPVDGETIVLDDPWLGSDLVDARDTTRAVTVQTVTPLPDNAVMADHLTGAPGVAVQRTGPGQGAPIVRGMIGSAVLVLVNGIRLNNAIFRPAPNQYTALIDAWAIERVEIVRGPGSTLFGSDALGGTINLVTPLPLFDSADWRQRGDAVVAVSSAARSVIARAAGATGRRDGGVALGVTWQRHGDRRTGGGAELVPSGYSSLAADLTGHREWGRHASTAWFQFLVQPELPRTDELVPGFGMATPAADEWLYHPSRRAFAHVRHLVRRPFARVQGAELHLAWQRIDDGRRVRDHGAAETLVESNRDDTFGATARASIDAPGGQLIVGAELWTDRVASARDELVGGERTATTARFASGARMNQVAAFSQLRRRFGRVTLQSGLRGAVVDLDIPAADRGQGAAITEVDWAGELGGAVELTTGVSVIGNLGRAFRVPNVHDLSTLGPRPGDRWQVPAAGLAAEHAVGADVGVRVDRSALTMEGFVFVLGWDDRIDVRPTGDLTETGRTVVQSANVGRARQLGAEAAITVRPHRRVEIAADVSYVRGDQGPEDAVEPADRMPPLGGGVRARWTLGAVEFGAGARCAAAQRRLSARDRDDPRIDPTGTPAYVSLQASAQARLAGFAITLAVDNVLDRLYREHGSGTPEAGLDVGLMVRRGF